MMSLYFTVLSRMTAFGSTWYTKSHPINLWHLVIEVNNINSKFYLQWPHYVVTSTRNWAEIWTIQVNILNKLFTFRSHSQIHYIPFLEDMKARNTSTPCFMRCPMYTAQDKIGDYGSDNQQLSVRSHRPQIGQHSPSSKDLQSYKIHSRHLLKMIINTTLNFALLISFTHSLLVPPLLSSFKPQARLNAGFPIVLWIHAAPDSTWLAPICLCEFYHPLVPSLQGTHTTLTRLMHLSCLRQPVLLSVLHTSRPENCRKAEDSEKSSSDVCNGLDSVRFELTRALGTKHCNMANNTTRRIKANHVCLSDEDKQARPLYLQCTDWLLT